LLCVSTAQNEIFAFAFFIVTGKSNFYGSVAIILFCNATLLRIAGAGFPAPWPFEPSSSGMLTALLPQE
jgi:hypothetical protein